MISLRFWRTLVLALVAIVFSQLIGIMLGIYAARNQYKLGDTLATLFAFGGIVIPKFIVALVVLYFLAFVYHSPYIGAFYSPEFIIQDHFSLAKLWDGFLHVWPVIAISVWAGQAYTLRVMRGNLLDVMNMQYIETARAKGLSRDRTLWRHAVPNALHPIIMNLGGRFNYMIVGEIEVAIVLALPTIGPLILSSVTERDMYVIAAIFLIVSVAIVVGEPRRRLPAGRTRSARPAGHHGEQELMANVTDLEMAAGPAEAKATQSLSYNQLVRRRFRRNPWGMGGLIICLLIVLTAVFPGFIAPYSATTVDSRALYSPPQLVRVAADGGLARPHVLGYSEEMDPFTFAITFIADPDKRANLALFVKGDEWQFLGLTFRRHLFGTTDGQPFHLLGTDGLGRDVFSRMIHGTRITLLMGFLVMLAAGFIGTVMGVSSGYFGGFYDLVVQRLVEFIKAFPDLPLYLALVSLLPRRADAGLVFLMFAAILVVLQWADVSRELRGKVLSMRSLEYVRAAEAVGAGSGRILFLHLLPNVSSHIIVWATYALPGIILLESFLSFLGVGVKAPMVSWGSMLNQILDFQSFSAAPWMLAPVGMIVLSVLAFNAFGDGLRDAMDPYSNV